MLFQYLQWVFLICSGSGSQGADVSTTAAAVAPDGGDGGDGDNDDGFPVSVFSIFP